MKLINKILRCSHCGCIFLPDAATCPKCGKACDNKRTNINSMLTFNGLNCLTSMSQTGRNQETIAV